ncbi:UbiX family flavin prenyltransferase [uncultured Fretibacterium sp.]|uniref:UbiX family flavin prenyltransferase n=1 Tax=uncultured Fretibacterium sp. TaxID=1678694 RepID=UPI00261A2C99|nr:UbiX family flavin prenyltransferase [uncultured Fretibacterium sp.]
MREPVKIVVGITGGSGAVYALALLRQLRILECETHLVVSRMGAYVMDHECGVSLEELRTFADRFYEDDDLAAPISGGSFRTFGMAVVPCSMKTLASIAGGFSESLLTRAADVTLKERRRLVLVTRESPLSVIHLENMLAATRAGAVVMPASPGFYHRPESVAEMVVSFSGRILDALGVEHNLTRRWEGAGTQ